MGKNNNNNKKDVKTPKKPIEAPKTETTSTTETTPVVQLNQFEAGAELIAKNNTAGLDPNHRVDLLKMMHETFRMDPDAAQKYHMDVSSLAKVNEITARAMIATMVCEVAYAKNPFAMYLNKSSLPILKQIGEEMGMTINIDIKALPKPDDNGGIEITSDQIKISKETKKELEEEQKVLENDKIELDPTKIENNEQLKEALLYILASRTNNWQKINEAVNFMRSYLSVQANKSENKEKELEIVKTMPSCEVIDKISEIVDRCPFVLNQIGRAMTGFTSQTKSPISAFCMFKDTTKDRKTGVSSVSDEEIADYVKAIISWSIKVSKANYEKAIADRENDIKTLSKDAKKNAKGIEDCNNKIAELKASIEYFNKTLNCVLNPTGEVADNLLENIKSEDVAIKTTAKRIFDTIKRTYYADVDTDACNPNDVKHNVQQYAGIIINLFRKPDEHLDYSEANLVSLEPVANEESKSEDGSKK